MGGLLPELAREAAHLGWSKAHLLAIHRWAKEVGLTIDHLTLGGWGLVGEDGLILYKSYTIGDIEAAFTRTNVNVRNLATCYTDGSGTTGTKPAGIGVVVYQESEPVRMFAENIGPGSNNRAELVACWRALRAFPDASQPIRIMSDSEYAIGALTKDWVRNSHAELIANIREDLDQRQGKVAFEHVDGHEGHEGNETADRLANLGRKLVTQVSVYEG